MYLISRHIIIDIHIPGIEYCKLCSIFVAMSVNNEMLTIDKIILLLIDAWTIFMIYHLHSPCECLQIYLGIVTA